jgi:hypothetical protein
MRFENSKPSFSFVCIVRARRFSTTLYNFLCDTEEPIPLILNPAGDFSISARLTEYTSQSFCRTLAGIIRNDQFLERQPMDMSRDISHG